MEKSKRDKIKALNKLLTQNYELIKQASEKGDKKRQKQYESARYDLLAKWRSLKSDANERAMRFYSGIEGRNKCKKK